MDFNSFNSRALAETGAEMTIRHPGTGKPILHGEDPCVVIVRGTESASAQAALKAARQRRMGEEKPDEAGRSLEDLHSDMVEAALPLILGFRHVSLGGKDLTAADARAFLGLNMINGEQDADGKGLSFVEQILNFAGTRANFLPKPVTGRSSSSGNSAGSTPNGTK